MPSSLRLTHQLIDKHSLVKFQVPSCRLLLFASGGHAMFWRVVHGRAWQAHAPILWADV